MDIFPLHKNKELSFFMWGYFIYSIDLISSHAYYLDLTCKYKLKMSIQFNLH